MRVGRYGRVTIPKDLRREFDIRQGDEVVFAPSPDHRGILIWKRKENGDEREDGDRGL